MARLIGLEEYAVAKIEDKWYLVVIVFIRPVMF